MKAIKHSLCEFDKYYRAVLENTSKRKYRGGGNRSAPELSCALYKNKLIKLKVDITARKYFPDYSESGQNLSQSTLAQG